MRNCSPLGVISITAILCAYTLVGCFGRWGGCRSNCRDDLHVPRCIPIQGQSSASSGSSPLGDPPIAVEEFVYSANLPLNGLSGGTGWGGPWYDTANNYNITAPGLTHPAQTSDTSVAGNNTATGTGGDTATPMTSLKDHIQKNNLISSNISSTSVTRFLSADSLTSISNALNSSGGLWFRCLMCIPSSAGLNTPFVGFYFGNAGIMLGMSAQTGEYVFTFGGSYVTNPYTVNLDTTYMFVVSIVLSDSTTGEFTANLWLLDPTVNVFDSTSSPSATLTSCMGPPPINVPIAAVGMVGSATGNVDGIYIAPSPVGLILSLPSQTTKAR